MYKKLMTLSVIFVLAGTALGQSGSGITQLTLQDCIKIAMKRNTSVLQAQYQAQSQDAKLLSAYGALLPTVSASGQFSYQNSQILNGVNVGGVIIPLSTKSISRRYQGTLSADYTLFDGTANIAGLNLVKHQSQSSDLSFRRAKQTAVYQTTQNYLAVFNARDQLKISEDNLKRDERQLESIKESNSVGSASLADVYQQQAVVSGDEYSLVQAKNAYDQAQANLRFFLGIPVTDSVTFADEGITSEIDTTDFAAVNRKYNQTAVLIQDALNSRADYEAARENVAASKSSLTIAEAAYSPTVSAFAQYQVFGPKTSNIGDNRILYGGLSISLPIFNGFQTQTNIQVADVNLKSAQETLDATKRQVQLDVYKAMLNLFAAEKGYESAVNAVAYAKINLETAQEKYKIGSGTLLDVLTANAIYTQDLSNQVVAAYTYVQAKQQMDYAIGTINY